MGGGGGVASSYNLGIGNNSLSSLAATGATGNVAIGDQALSALTTGDFNIGIGAQSNMGTSSVTRSVMIGYDGHTADYSVSVGNGAKSGQYTVAIGSYSGNMQLTNSVIVGAIDFNASTAVGPGDNNIVIGYGAGMSAIDGSVSNEITLGNSSITKFRIPGLSIDWDSSNLPATLTGTETLTNKTLSDPTVTGTGITFSAGEGSILLGNSNGVLSVQNAGLSTPSLNVNTTLNITPDESGTRVIDDTGLSISSSNSLNIGNGSAGTTNLAGIFNASSAYFSSPVQFLATGGGAAAAISAGTATITANTATVVDTALTSDGACEYTLTLIQHGSTGDKIRASKVLVTRIASIMTGAASDMSEYAIVETGNGNNNGQIPATIEAVGTMMGTFLQITVTDAADSNVSVKFSKVVL